MKWSTIYIVPLFSWLVVCQRQDIYLEPNAMDFVKSPGFPTSCCAAQSVTIRHMSSSIDNLYLRMTFDDLDIPVGSRLEIFDGDKPDRKSLFPTQPELLYGVWSRPVIASSNLLTSIHIRFQPSNESSSGHVGYKARVWVTNSPPDRWHDKPITDECKPVASPFSGDRITQKTLGHRYGPDQVIDCVWQIKVPPVTDDEELRKGSLMVYARITQLSFTGYFDVHGGASSEGPSLLALSSPPAVSMGDVTNMHSWGYTSPNGLYVHLSMLNKDRGLLELIIGIFHFQSNLLFTGTGDDTDGQRVPLCSFGSWGPGFLCVDDGWCIPETHKCNHVRNCASGQDEDVCNVEPTVSPARPITTPTTPTTVVGSSSITTCEGIFNIMCRDGACGSFFEMCRDRGGSMCEESSTQKYCPHLGGCVNKIDIMGRDSVSCMGYCGACDGGGCTMDGKCPGDCAGTEKKCPEGCVASHRLCRGECESWERKCGDGQCRAWSEVCPVESCPPDKSNRCMDGVQCYSDRDKCDDYNDCLDATDEQGCSTKVLGTTVFWMVGVSVGVVIILCAVVACHAGRKKAANRGSVNEPAVEMGEVHSGIGQNYTGTRMRPVAPSSAYGTSQGPDSAYLMGPTGNADGVAEPTAPMMGLPTPSAPPPSYDDVVPTGPEKPPPSYNTVEPPFS